MPAVHWPTADGDALEVIGAWGFQLDEFQKAFRAEAEEFVEELIGFHFGCGLVVGSAIHCLACSNEFSTENSKTGVWINRSG
jgi:hypothetical protein